jgi:hypothetical protein
MKLLMWLGVALIAAWIVLWLGIKIAAVAVHLVLLVGVGFILWALLRRRPRPRP